MKKTILYLLLLILVISFVSAQTDHTVEGHEEVIDIVYFYGTGCPHCAKLEIFLEDIEEQYEVNIVSYEVYGNESNRELAIKMAEEYGDSFRGVPITFIGDSVFVGFSDSIGEEIEAKIISCVDKCCDSPLETIKICEQKEDVKEKFTLGAIVSLAIADSINPCALAVLAMALIALLANDPTKKKNVLLGGLAFSTAVFFTYIFYGLVIIQFFKSIEQLFTSIGVYVRIVFALAAIFLAAMNIKDYFKYKPGGFATEMPMFMRPFAKNMIKNITRPRGAFVIGILVTLFLLPCTIGPYVIVGNLLSGIDWVVSVPWLILYNLIFVLPMIIVTLFVYFGYTTVDKVTGWKEENIKYLHLVAGIVLGLLGIAMLLGYI